MTPSGSRSLAAAAKSRLVRGAKRAHTNRGNLVTRAALILLAVVFLGLFIVLPLAVVFIEASRKGVSAYFAAFNDPVAWSAIRLTLIAARIAVPLNVVFGLAASWSIAKFEFRGRQLLLTLIDLPFSVSPVLSGLVYVLLLGAQGYLGPWLIAHDIKVIFAVPVLTFPRNSSLVHLVFEVAFRESAWDFQSW